jgi:transposase
MLTDAQWTMLEPLIEAVRPKGKTSPQDLRRTIEAILWRHGNGAKWRSAPAELGPWWRAARTFMMVPLLWWTADEFLACYGAHGPNWVDVWGRRVNL